LIVDLKQYLGIYIPYKNDNVIQRKYYAVFLN